LKADNPEQTAEIDLSRCFSQRPALPDKIGKTKVNNAVICILKDENFGDFASWRNLRLIEIPNIILYN